MEFHNDYDAYISEILKKENLSEDEKLIIKSKSDEFKHGVERRFDVWMKVLFSIAVVVLFGVSYYYAQQLINSVLTSEIELMKTGIIKASERSINSTTIAALLAATVTQTGLAFLVITKYLFPTREITVEKSQ